MKRIIILIIFIFAILSCSYMEGGERAMRERGWECMYNYKGEIQGCNYIK